MQRRLVLASFGTIEVNGDTGDIYMREMHFRFDNKGNNIDLDLASSLEEIAGALRKGVITPVVRYRN